MKKLMMLAMSVMTALALTFIPQKSVASNAVVDVLKVAAIVALVAIDIDQMNRCDAGQLQYCDYYDYNHCEYQTVHRSDVITSCRSYGRYSTYDCVQSRQDSTIYIKSCNGGFQNRY